MNVKLIAYTQWNEWDEPKESGRFSTEDIISYCARVSNPKNQENFDTSAKLLKYCMDHKHWSIFEMSNVVMEINTTRDIARQILRHRSFHFQEFSQRYADPMKEGLGFTTREARLQDTKNRQNSIEVDDAAIKDEFLKLQKLIQFAASMAYKAAIQLGIAKEQARVFLPEGLTMSRMYMNGTVRDWFHYCQLRMGPETQKEHRLIAQACWDELVKVYPFLENVAIQIEEDNNSDGAKS